MRPKDECGHSASVRHSMISWHVRACIHANTARPGPAHTRPAARARRANKPRPCTRAPVACSARRRRQLQPLEQHLGHLSRRRQVEALAAVERHRRLLQLCEARQHGRALRVQHCRAEGESAGLHGCQHRHQRHLQAQQRRQQPLRLRAAWAEARTQKHGRESFQGCGTAAADQRARLCMMNAARMHCICPQAHTHRAHTRTPSAGA